jgi:hypothetical protein
MLARATCQNLTTASFVLQLTTEIKSAGYDADHYTVAVSLPVSTTLRSHSLNLYLEEKVENFDPDQVVPIKQVMPSY